MLEAIASPGEVLASRPRFRRLLVRTGISKLGNAIAHFALPLIILQRTGSAAGMALGVLFECAPHFLFGPFLGSLADRVDRRRLLIASDACQIALTLAIAAYLALFPDSSSVWPLYLACFAGSLIDVAYWVVAEFCLVPRLVPPHMLGAANSLYFATATSAAILGPLVGGKLLAFGMPALVFALDALTFVATLLFWLELTPESFGLPTPAARQSSTAQRVGESLKIFLSHEVLFPLFAALFLSNLGNSCRTNLLVFHWGKVMELPKDEVGLRVAILALVSIAGNLLSPFLPRLAREGRLFLAHWTCTAMIGLALALLPASDAGLLGAAIWMDLCGAAVWIYTFHARQVFVPAANLAGVNAIARAVLLASVSLSSMVFLPLAERIGVRATMAVQGLPLALAIGLWIRHRRLRDMTLARRALA
jgi:MFS family permease